MAAIANAAPAPLRSAPPRAPPELDRVVRRALEKDRDARYQSAHELLRDIESLRERRSGAAAADGPRRRRPAPGGGGASRRLPQSSSPLDPPPAGSSTGATAHSGSGGGAPENRRSAARRRIRCGVPAAAKRRDGPGRRPGTREDTRKVTLVPTARVRTSPPGADVVHQGLRRDRKRSGSTSDARRSRTSARRSVITVGACKRTGYSTFEGAGPLGMSEVRLRCSPTGTLPAGHGAAFRAARSRRRMRRRVALPPFYLDTTR